MFKVVILDLYTLFIYIVIDHKMNATSNVLHYMPKLYTAHIQHPLPVVHKSVCMFPGAQEQFKLVENWELKSWIESQVVFFCRWSFMTGYVTLMTCYSVTFLFHSVIGPFLYGIIRERKDR